MQTELRPECTTGGRCADGEVDRTAKNTDLGFRTGQPSMTRFLLAFATSLFADPAIVQMEVTCGDYTLMGKAKQMETLAASSPRPA